MPQEQRVILREKALSDTERDYKWKSDAELASLDATLPWRAELASLNTPLPWRSAFAEFAAAQARDLQRWEPTSHAFAIDTIEGEHIGNCAYYNLSTQRGEAEIGITIGERAYWDKGYGTEAVNLLVEYLFQRLDLKAIYLRTLDWNKRAQKCFVKCGFVPCGHLTQRQHNFIMMKLCRHEWEKTRDNQSPLEDGCSAPGEQEYPPENGKAH